MTAPESAPDPAHDAVAHQRARRRGRWLLWIVLAAVLLLGLAAGGIQLALSSDLPRQLVLSELHAETGLRIAAGSVTTGWAGQTTLRDVSFALPLAEEPFLTVPVMEAEHTSLAALLIGRALHIDKLRLVEPRIELRQDAAGRWNLQEAFLRIAQTDAANRAAGKPDTNALMPLPAIAVTGGQVHIADNAGRSASLGPIAAQVTPAGGGASTFTVAAPPQLQLDGRLVAGTDWRHEAQFSLRELKPVLGPWLGEWAEPAHAAGSWRGRLTDGNTLAGTLALGETRLGALVVLGDAAIVSDTEGLTITPQVTVEDRGRPWPGPVRIASGTLRLQESGVRVESLIVRLLRGSARVNGQLDWQDRAARLDAEWVDLEIPGGGRHSGQVAAALQTPFPDRPHIQATLTSTGAIPRGQWDARIEIAGQGKSWSDIQWELTAPRLAWTGKPEPLDLSGLVAQLVTAPPTVRLTRLQLAGTDRLTGAGQINLDDRRWQLELGARAVPLPRIPPANIALSASGAPGQIELKSLQFASGGATITGSGRYDPAQRDRPLQLDLVLSLLPAAWTQAADSPLIAGALLSGTAHFSGSIEPLRGSLRGKLSGQKVRIGNRQIGDLVVDVTGRLDSDALVIQSREMLLLDGRWSIGGRCALADGSIAVDVAVADLPLEQADSLLPQPLAVQGTARAQVKIELPQADLKKLASSGQWSITGLRRGSFVAEHIAGRIAFADQVAIADQIVMRQGTGRAQGQVRYNLRQPTQLAVEAEAERWPVRDERHKLEMDVSGKTKLAVTATTRPAARGPLELAADVRLDDKPLATLRANALFDGPAIAVNSLDAELLGGRVSGQARLLLDEPLKSTARLQWTDIQAAALARRWPALKGLRGTFSGQVAAARPDDPHVTEPLAIRVAVRSRDASYNAMHIGDGEFVLLVSRAASAPGIADRIVLDRSWLEVAGGQLRLWARATSHEGVLFSQLHVQADLDKLDLDQLVHVAEPAAEPMIGRLSGQVTVFGPPRQLRRAVGEAQVRLDNSELGNSDIIAALNRTLRLQPKPEEPAGVANARLRLENGALIVRSLRYQTPGLDARASLVVEDIARGADSPISGYAIGSARPLAEIKLPYFAELDDVLSALQTSVTTFRVAGTLRDPKVAQADLAELGQTLRKYLLFEDPGQSP